MSVYKALKCNNVLPNGWIAIPGAGGGLGHLDSGEEKRKLCLSLGAEKWVDFKESGDVIKDVVAAADGLGPHAVLVTAGVAEPCTQACYYVRKRGTIVMVGVPPTPFQVPFEVLVGKEIKLVGSGAGSRQDAVEALDIAARGKVACHYTTRSLEELETVFEEMKRGEIAGRVVLKV